MKGGYAITIEGRTRLRECLNTVGGLFGDVGSSDAGRWLDARPFRSLVARNVGRVT
jgi:hypothetical protein